MWGRDINIDFKGTRVFEKKREMLFKKQEDNLPLGPEVYKEQAFFLGMSEILKKLE